jgi:hypothetical protein
MSITWRHEFGRDMMYGWAPSTLPLNGDDQYDKCGYYIQSSNGNKYSQSPEKGAAGLPSGVSVGSSVHLVYTPAARTIHGCIDGAALQLLYSEVLPNLQPAVLFWPPQTKVTIVA